MKFYRIFIALSLVFLLGIPLHAQQANNNNRIRLAQALERNGDYETALDIYQKLFHSGDHSFGVLFGLRKTLTRLQRYPQLIQFLKEMIRTQPKQYMNAVELGRAYALNQQKDKALEEWNLVLRQYSKNSGVYQAVGRVMTELRLFDEAVKIYKEGLKRFKKKSVFYMDLATIYRAQLDYEQAALYLIEYYRANKKQLGFVRSQLNSMAKNDEEAQRILKIVQLADQKNPQDNGVREILASMYLRLREFGRALEIYKTLPGGWYLLNFAKEAGLAGAYQYVEQAYRLALQRERNPKRQNDLHYLLAQTCYRRAQKLQRSASETEVHEKAQCAQEELKKLSEQKSDKRNRWRAGVLLGDIQDRFYANEAKALDYYTQVQSEAPIGTIRAKTLNKVAEIYLEQNNLDAAKKEYEAIRQPIIRPFADYELGLLAYYKGNFSEALNRFSDLQKRLQPQDTLTNNMLQKISFITMNLQDSLLLLRFARAELLQRRQQWDAAAKAFGGLAETPGALALPAALRATQIYLSRKRVSEAFVLLNGFLQRQPQNPGNDRVLLLLGNINEQMNRPKQAQEYYLNLIRTYSDSFYLEEARQRARALQETAGRE